jgi:hypothetical protein
MADVEHDATAKGSFSRFDGKPLFLERKPTAKKRTFSLRTSFIRSD